MGLYDSYDSDYPANYYDQMEKEWDAWQREAMRRAQEQRDEADRAGDIWNRDERVVAGEDTERAAETAANLAKSQLGASAGLGAAGVAGMQAAQQTRDKEYANLLLRARERKDSFEQKEVERRQNSYLTLMDALSAKQAAIRDRQLREYIMWYNAQALKLQQAGAGGITINNLVPGGGTTVSPEITIEPPTPVAPPKPAAPPKEPKNMTLFEIQEAIRACTSMKELMDLWKKVPFMRKSAVQKDYDKKAKELTDAERKPKADPPVAPDPSPKPPIKGGGPGAEYDTKDPIVQRINTATSKAELQKIVDSLTEMQFEYYSLLLNEKWEELDGSDERLKIYSDQGHNAGIEGDAVQSEAIATAKAADQYSQQGLEGINDALGRRWG